MSKGSKQRPTDLEAYQSNYDAIFGKKLPTYMKQHIEESSTKKVEKKPKKKKD